MKYLRELFIAVLIFALFWAVFEYLRADKVNRVDREQLEQRMKVKFDSVVELQHAASLYALEMDGKVTRLERDTRTLGDQMLKVIKQNAYLRKTYAPLLADSTLEREIATLYKNR